MKFKSVAYGTVIFTATGLLALKPLHKPVMRAHKSNAPHTVSITHDEFPVPQSLQHLCYATVRHIRATPQAANQCGSRSVANALAIQELVISGQALTSTNIRSAASHYDSILINNALEWFEVAELAAGNNLSHAHIMAKMPPAQRGTTMPYIIFSAKDQAYSLDILVTELRSNPSGIAHIMYNTGGHWVLISIVKQEGEQTQIIYMDSGNSRLQESSCVTGCINYLYNNCIA